MSDVSGSNDLEKGEKSAGNTVVLHGLEEGAPDGTVHRTIGTGLFVGAGGALNQGGPGGILLGYSIMGAVVYSMMVALGEMCTLYPVSGAFTHYAARFVDPALGFAMGWNYWYSYAITLPAEISAAAFVIQYWSSVADLNVAIWISVFLVVICSFNFLGVRAYGEAEFWLSIIKIVTIIGLLILGLIITCGGVPGSPAIGFRYWKRPGPFVQLNGIPGAGGRFLSFWYTFVQAAFVSFQSSPCFKFGQHTDIAMFRQSYLGTEIVALTAGEAANPRRNVPKAIRRVFYRILVFYGQFCEGALATDCILTSMILQVFGVLMIGMLVSPTDPSLLHGSGAAKSPWVIAITNAGIKGLPSVINTVVLLSAFSAGNSDLYAASRTLYGLACDGKAPAIFRKCTKNGLPIYCLIVTAAFGLLAYMSVGSSAANVFNDLVNLSSITGLITWGTILISYLRFYAGCKAQGIDRNEFPFVAPFQPWASYFGLFFNGFTVFLSGQWNATNFVIAYITIAIFFVFFVFWKFYKKTKFVSVSAMDFETGRRELDEMSDNEAAKMEEPTTWYGKVWAAVM
ncbi:hypothetical protein P7C70_g3871, partial [Phenoliferia sp. Uapishka_3]